MSAGLFWTASLGFAMLVRGLIKLAGWAYACSTRTPELPLPLATAEEQYQHDIVVEQARELAAWDQEFQGATGKCVDWLLNPAAKIEYDRQLELQNRACHSHYTTLVAPGLHLLQNQQQQDKQAQMNQQAAQQAHLLNLLGQVGQAGQFNSAAPADLNGFLQGLGNPYSKKPS